MIDGVPTNDRPVVLQPTDNGIRIGGQKWRSPSFGGRIVRKLKESAVIYSATLRFTLEILPELPERKASAQEGNLAGISYFYRMGTRCALRSVPTELLAVTCPFALQLGH
jgi:hypothetical protein